jgi:hypothetical protein
MAQVYLFKLRSVSMSCRYIRSDFIVARGRNQRFDFVQQFLYFHVTREAWIDFNWRFEVRLVSLAPKNDLQHSIENHLRLLSNNMTEISHYLPKLVLVFNNILPSQKEKSYTNLSIQRICFNQNITIWSLVVSESQTGKLNFLILPLPMYNICLI